MKKKRTSSRATPFTQKRSERSAFFMVMTLLLAVLVASAASPALSPLLFMALAMTITLFTPLRKAALARIKR